MYESCIIKQIPLWKCSTLFYCFTKYLIIIAHNPIKLLAGNILDTLHCLILAI